MAYLIHYNKNHSKANGQFVRGDGDGDGTADEHHRYTNRSKYVMNSWAVRKKFQNKDGTLTELGKRSLAAKKRDDENLKTAKKEANKLFKQSKRLKDDFGGKWDEIDDEDFFSETAKEYGLDTKAYDRAMKIRNDFKDNNKKYISDGSKMVNKMQDIEPERWKNYDRSASYETAKARTILTAVMGLPVLTIAGAINTANEKANYDRYKFLDEQK